MSTVEKSLAEARKLTPEEQRQLASALLIKAERQNTVEDGIQEALTIVEETSGSIKGLDQETIIWSATESFSSPTTIITSSAEVSQIIR